MKKTNEIILAFIGEPTSDDSPCTSTGHGYDAFICTESNEVYNLFNKHVIIGSIEDAISVIELM